jgi:hypothetical protein
VASPVEVGYRVASQVEVVYRVASPVVWGHSEVLLVVLGHMGEVWVQGKVLPLAQGPLYAPCRSLQ